jgi:hypothetical protein
MKSFVPACLAALAVAAGSQQAASAFCFTWTGGFSAWGNSSWSCGPCGCPPCPAPCVYYGDPPGYCAGVPGYPPPPYAAAPAPAAYPPPATATARPPVPYQPVGYSPNPGYSAATPSYGSGAATDWGYSAGQAPSYWYGR